MAGSRGRAALWSTLSASGRLEVPRGSQRGNAGEDRAGQHCLSWRDSRIEYMATQRLTPETGLSLSMPTGDGRLEAVELPTEGIHPALLVANEQSPVDAASYRNVADQLLGADWWSPRRIFVTSPIAGDGKTCTAFNLAWALSTRGAS